MDKRKIAVAFNEWMRRYIDKPEEFDREFQSIQQHLQEKEAGREPSYGSACAEYLTQLVEQTS